MRHRRAMRSANERYRVVPFLSRLSNADLAKVNAQSSVISVPPRTVLERAGARRSELLVLLTGGVMVTDNDVPVGILGPGTHFGGAAIGSLRRRACFAVTTILPSELIAFSSVELMSVVRDVPAFGEALTRVPHYSFTFEVSEGRLSEIVTEFAVSSHAGGRRDMTPQI